MKHILITGSTRGIGFGLAKRFLEAGCKVTINGTTEKNLSNALAELKKDFSSKVQGFQADVVNPQDVENLWMNAVKGFGEIDIWINNAGMDQQRRLVWDIDQGDVKKIINTNLMGVINGSITAFRKMQEQGKGQIFNMEGFGSDGMIRETMTLYGTTKRAVRYFSRSLALEAKKTPVLIGTLSPGMVVTDILLQSVRDNSEEAERNKKIFNILADHVDTVTSFLSKRILENQKNNAHIAWLNKPKVMWRFMSAPFNKRNLFD